MTDLERFHACMEYRPVDHVPFWDWGAWPENLRALATGGLRSAAVRAGACGDQRHWFGGWFHPCPAFTREVLAEDAVSITYRNHEGIILREMRDQPWSSMPQFLRFPVQTRADFRQFWRERMQPDLAQRIGPDWKQQLQQWRAQPIPLVIISDRWVVFFGPLRNLVGVEDLCTLFYDDPALWKR